MSKIKAGHIVGAVLVTLVWSATIGGLVYWHSGSLVKAIWCGLAYMFVHPIIGKVWSKVLDTMCKGID